jgi:protein-arginine kinase activator protein McsA
MTTSKQRAAFLKLPKCKKCGKRAKLERHHIVYDPEITVTICIKCHKEITRLNKQAARSTRVYHKLTNLERILIWLRFSGT